MQMPQSTPTPSGSPRSRTGERRIVTALFCDVAGSTSIAEQLDPEEWADIMNEAFGYLTGPVQRYEGTVARLMGDAILAFFGAPVSHEEDPQRAVLAGLEIVRSIAPFKEEIKRDYGFEFDVRVGINTGPVVVGDVGSAQAFEYTALGDAVNIAARMEQTAKPGTVQVAEATYRLVAPLFEFEDLGGVEVKGKTEPVRAYRALRAKAQPGSVRGIAGLASPIVGREVELAVVRQVLAGAIEGRGHVVSIVGEAGLGKSRLLAELRREWTDRGYQWHEGRGVAYDVTRPYGVFYHLCRRVCGLDESDTPEQARAKIAASFEGVADGERDGAVRAVQMLLAVHGSDMPDLQGDAFKRELYNAMTAIWRIKASDPCALVMDDIHWSDPESMDLLIRLVDVVEEASLVLLCAFRPDREAVSWKFHQQMDSEYPHRYTEIQLKPLSDQDTDTLVNNLLTIADLPPSVRTLIMEKTEGNPFFVEEVVRTLIDSGVVVRDDSGDHWRATMEIESIAIPDNLQTLLISRIDRLDEEARRTLQVASVVGRTFPYRVLKRVLVDGVPIDRHLSTLQRVDLIREASRLPELEYIFKHELTRQAAYDSILRRRRPEFHRQVAEAMEELFADRLDEEAHRLADHFGLANNDEKCLAYSVMAGDNAAWLYANDEAVRHYSRAIELAEKLGRDSRTIADLWTKRGRTLELGSRLDQALESYEELEFKGRSSGDKLLEVAGITAAATILATLNKLSDPQRAREMSERGLAIADEIGDPKYQAKTLWNLLLTCFFGAGTNEEGIAFGERSIAIAREHGLKEQLAFSLNDINRLYFEAAMPDEALDSLREAAALWRELNNLPMLADNLEAMADQYAFMGQTAESKVLTEESLGISRSIGNLWGEGVALLTSSFLQMEEGRFGDTLESVTRGEHLAEQAGFTGVFSFSGTVKAIILATLGAPEEAIEAAERAIELSNDSTWTSSAGVAAKLLADHLSGSNAISNEEIVDMVKEMEREGKNRYLQWMFPVGGQLLLHRGLAEQALALANRSIASKEQHRVKVGLPDLYLLKARALSDLGRVDEAYDVLQNGIEIAERYGLRRALWELYADLASIEEERGDTEAAAKHWTLAKEIVEFIAEHAGTPQHVASFASTPAVQAILAR